MSVHLNFFLGAIHAELKDGFGAFFKRNQIQLVVGAVSTIWTLSCIFLGSSTANSIARLTLAVFAVVAMLVEEETRPYVLAAANLLYPVLAMVASATLQNPAVTVCALFCTWSLPFMLRPCRRRRAPIKDLTQLESSLHERFDILDQRMGALERRVAVSLDSNAQRYTAVAAPVPSASQI